MHDVNELLFENEHVLFRTQKHWMVFSYSVIWAAVGVYLFWREPNLQIFGLTALGFSIVMWIYGLIQLLGTRFYLTEDRFIFQQGLIRPRDSQMLYTAVKQIECTQGWFGRLYGYGTVTLAGSDGLHYRFPHIRDPQKFCNQLQEQLDSTSTETND